jgi:hypothetical protein
VVQHASCAGRTRGATLTWGVPTCRVASALLIGAVSLLPLRRAAAQHAPAPSFGHLAAQAGVGVVAMPIGFIGGGLATRWIARRAGASDEGSSAGLVGAYAGAALATAAGPTIVGAGPHASGTYLGALGGAVIGGAASFGLVRLNRLGDAGGVLRVLSLVAVVALPGIGATAGYDLTRGYRR